MARTKKPKPDSDADPVADQPPSKDIDQPADAETKAAAEPVPEPDPVVDSPGEQPEEAPEPPEPTKPDTPAAPATAPEKHVRRGAIAPALIGGFLAASLGFLAARTEILDPVLPGFLKSAGTGDAVAALQDADVKQTDALAALQAELQALEPTDLGPVNAQLATIQADIARLDADSEATQTRLHDLESRLDPLNARLEELEKRPMTEGASQAAIAAYDRELAALRAAVAAQRADVEKMVDDARATKAAARALEENAAKTARNAQNQATFVRLLAALESGASYAPVLAELVSAGVDVPDALNASANDGVATLSALADAFPAAARAALSAARDTQGNSGGIGGFLQRQLGARSVEPREGDDPDAVLSRAEAAVTDGDISLALEEISKLPDPARAAMQNWIALATTRLTALQAADKLAQGLNTN